MKKPSAKIDRWLLRIISTYLFIIFCFDVTDLLHTFCMSAALEGCSEKRIQNLLCQLISDNTCTKCDDLCIVVSDCHLS